MQSSHNSFEEIYAVCNLSIVPVRTEPNDKAEMCTQLLFGESFIISKFTEDGKWAYIQNLTDDYFGWIDAKQYKSVSKEYVETLHKNPTPVSKGLFGIMKGHRKIFPVLMGSLLPMYNNGQVRIDDEIYVFEGEYTYPAKGTPSDIEKTAKFYLFSPYLWGGKTHYGIDCSGLVQQVFMFNGYKLPRDSSKQEEMGMAITFGMHKKGDLAFFHNVTGRVIHVGIVLDHDLIIHASGEVRIDKLDEVGIYNLDKKQYSHKLHSLKRVLSTDFL